MARNREALVLVLDVGPSMHGILPEVEKVCSMLVEKKLIFNKYDEVGIVLFGTEDTRNELTDEVGGYQHVVVLQNIKVVDGDLVDVLKQLPRGIVSGDFLDAIIVGMDMLIKKYGETQKGKKRILLVTDALFAIKDPYEGTKDDQVMTIAQQMTKHGMKMESVVVRGRLQQGADERIMHENDRLLNIFSEKTNAKLVHVESPTSLLGAIRTRSISPVTVFRGDLEISSIIKIKVWVYKKTSEEKFPTLKRYSDKAHPSDNFATHEVKVDYEYKSAEEPSKVVPPEHRIKGYRYGPQVVPISTAEWDAVKFKPEKSVKLLGFTDPSSIMRHYYMKDVNLFIAEPGNTRATVAVSALARAMKEMDRVAIVRCVWRQGQGSVVVGVLTPNISEKDGVPDSFYCNMLPFAEDVREFQFHSFSNFPASMQPNEEQQEASDNFVKMLDLAPSGREEALQPDFTPNPLLERFYRHLELKSKHPEAAVPLLDGTLKKITEPDPDLFSQNKFVIDTFCRQFELKENPKLKKSSRRSLREKASASSDREDNENIIAQILDSAAPANTSAVKVEKIGDLTALQDFEAMMSRRDDPEWIAKAINGLKNKIFDLAEDSVDSNNHPKALEYLLALRKGCIVEQEPTQFNDFLRQLYKFCEEKKLHSLCAFLASRQLTLISKVEAIDSEVPDDEARNFLVKLEPKLEQL